MFPVKHPAVIRLGRPMSGPEALLRNIGCLAWGSGTVEREVALHGPGRAKGWVRFMQGQTP